MYFNKQIEVATTNTESNKAVRTMILPSGIIHNIDVFFPTGCRGLVKCTIHHGGHQIFPSEEGMYAAGDGSPVNARMAERLNPGDTTIIIRAWAEGTSYNHTITAGIAILDEEDLTMKATIDKLAEAVDFLAYKIRTMF